MPVEEAAEKFNYRESTLYALLREAKEERMDLFPTVPRQKKTRKISKSLQAEAVRLRDSGMSAKEICRSFAEKEVNVSLRTIERLLAELGFSKLPRRTNKQLGITRKNTIIPESAEKIDFAELDPFSITCPAVGVFFFLPYIIESGIMDVVTKCRLPGSSIIEAEQACLSMLLDIEKLQSPISVPWLGGRTIEIIWTA